MSKPQREAKMPEAVITDEMIANMEAKAGADLRIDHSVYNEEATRIAVNRFTGGIGDINPLWTDAERGKASPYGSPIAPPSFVIGCFSGIQFGWPGLGSFHSETDWDLLRPVYWGDTIRSSCRYEGFSGPKPSGFAGKMVIDHFTNRYHNQHDEEVAVIKWSVINFERGAAKERSASKKAESNGDGLEIPHPWQEAEIQEIEKQVLSEFPRGEEPRYWEDVEVGHKVDTLTKGPIGLTDEVAFVSGGGPPIPRIKAHAAALHDYAKHPAWGFRDPVTGATEPIYAVHYNQQAAQAMGVAYQYDVGFQRQCWHVQLLTHWAGDHAWVRNSNAQYRGFVYLSDVIELSGEVTGKSVTDDGDHIVEIRTSAINQRGQDVMPGTAVVALPSRDDADSPAARRARK